MTDRSYKVDLFRPEDAKGVSQLFREVYGDGYPVKLVYDPDEFAKAVAKQDYIPVVARTPSGSIVGFESFYRSTPNPRLYEIGLGMVSVEYRRTAVFGLLSRRLVKLAFTLPDFDAFFAENVCNHILTQKAATIFKVVDTAIEVDLMPSKAYEKEESTKGRVSTIVSIRTLVPWPHVIYVPEIYKGYLEDIYRDFDDSRILMRSDEKLPSNLLTNMAVQIFEGANVTRISIKEAEVDFQSILDLAEYSQGGSAMMPCSWRT